VDDLVLVRLGYQDGHPFAFRISKGFEQVLLVGIARADEVLRLRNLQNNLSVAGLGDLHASHRCDEREQQARYRCVLRLDLDVDG
jgi:hypothetical protein